jgi:hypothetical protein
MSLNALHIMANLKGKRKKLPIIAIGSFFLRLFSFSYCENSKFIRKFS